MFNAEEYWRDKPYKKWVVNVARVVRQGGRRKKIQRTVLVAASTRGGAISTGIYYSGFTGKPLATARLATPQDLGCTPTT